MIQSEMPVIFGALDYGLFWLCVASAKVPDGILRSHCPKGIHTQVPLKDKCLLVIRQLRSLQLKTSLYGKDQ